MAWLTELLRWLDTWKSLAVTLIFPAAGGVYVALRSVADWYARRHTEKISEQQQLAVASLALVRQTSEQLLASEQRLNALLQDVDRLRRQGWHLQDTLTELHAATLAARVRVHQLEAAQQLPLTAFAPLPAIEAIT